MLDISKQRKTTLRGLNEASHRITECAQIWRGSDFTHDTLASGTRGD